MRWLGIVMLAGVIGCAPVDDRFATDAGGLDSGVQRDDERDAKPPPSNPSRTPDRANDDGRGRMTMDARVANPMDKAPPKSAAPSLDDLPCSDPSDEDGGIDDDDAGTAAVQPGVVSYAGGDGSSCAQAVIILGASSEFAGIAAEYAWLDAHYRGYRGLSQELTFCGCHFMDVLGVRLTDGRVIDVYFNIDAFFGLDL